MSYVITRIMKFFVKSSFTIAILMPILCFAKEKKEPKVVEVVKVDLKNITQSVRLIGTIRAKKSTELTAKVTGTLDYIAHAGQKISKGEIIAKLENADLERAYELSDSAERNSKDQYDRMNKLEKPKLAKMQDIEDRKNKWIEAQKAKNVAKMELEKTVFMAPFDGIVGGFKMREGAQVQVGEPIVFFYDPSELIVEFEIPTKVLELIENKDNNPQNKEQMVIIGGEKITVPNIQRIIDPKTHMSPAYVDYVCDNCVIGSNVTLDFIVARHKKVLVIPQEAMFRREGNTYVYVVREDKACLQAITPGINGKGKLEVSQGLSVGDLVIVRGHERLTPDMEVQIAGKHEALQQADADASSVVQKIQTS
jgi:membrane fusion protein, multidrug efflux system